MGSEDASSLRLGTLLEESETRRVFRHAISAWAQRDLDTLMPLVGDSIIHHTNVNPLVAPFAAPVMGKAAYRDKLQRILDTFEFGAYLTQHLKVNGSIAQANMKIIWIHGPTGERLQTGFRFVAKQHQGQIVQLAQYYDARYVEAFARQVSIGA